jgi:hypothetical protein
VIACFLPKLIGAKGRHGTRRRHKANADGREYVRGAVVLFRQFLLPFHDFARQPDDNIMIIRLSADCDGTGCGAFDLWLDPLLR